jgi:hypothetical protein
MGLTNKSLRDLCVIGKMEGYLSLLWYLFYLFIYLKFSSDNVNICAVHEFVMQCHGPHCGYQAAAAMISWGRVKRITQYREAVQEGACIWSIQQEQWQLMIWWRDQRAWVEIDAYAAALQLVGVWTIILHCIAYMDRSYGRDAERGRHADAGGGTYAASTLLLLCQRKGTNTRIMHTPEQSCKQARDKPCRLWWRWYNVPLLSSLAGPTTMPHAVNNKGENFQLTLPTYYYFCLSAGCRLQVFVCVSVLPPFTCRSLIVSVHTACMHPYISVKPAN